ncbi:hypothetical protein OKW45_000346 [Paraburkholderia sp. WSM4175]
MRSATVVLPVPGLPEKEAHMQGRRAARETQRSPRALDQQMRGDLANARFHGREPDQIAIEFAEHVADARVAVQRREVDVGRGGVAVRGGRGQCVHDGGVCHGSS